jgi:hypothetical protein
MPLQVGAELERMVRFDLLGPAGGPEEEVDERAVRGRYILGLLAPRGQTILPDCHRWRYLVANQAKKAGLAGEVPRRLVRPVAAIHRGP